MCGLCIPVSIIISYSYLLDTRIGMSLYTECTGNYVSHYYFLDTHIISTTLYTRCTGNYARIVHICFNYNPYLLDTRVATSSDVLEIERDTVKSRITIYHDFSFAYIHL